MASVGLSLGLSIIDADGGERAAADRNRGDGIPPGPPQTGRSVVGQATSAGLFYAVHGRPVKEYESRPFRSNPARVVFVRRDALLRRLRTSR